VRPLRLGKPGIARPLSRTSAGSAATAIASKENAMSMVENSYLSLGTYGFHRIVYGEWGSGDRVVVCAHGLTRNGHDFDYLCEALQSYFRLACPDLPGRGRSHWLPVPAEYRPPVYLNDMAALIARLGAEQVDWIGTSLGGLLGMMLAAQPNSPIRKLVVNDIGAFIGKAALHRIAGYVGTDPLFDDLGALEAYLREVHAPFGALTNEQWHHLARHSARHDTETSGLRLHYDPGLAVPFKEGFGEDVDLWPVWERITCPVLVLRGAESDILLAGTAEEMLTRGPQAELIEFPGVGHAPMLMDRGQIGAVREWLLR
jgi:pimeloyl-ACP methyl ester carboxylesterase